MENTLAYIAQIRKVLELLDACEPAIDIIYDLSQAHYGSYHVDYEKLNDVVADTRQVMTSKLSELENLMLPSVA